MKTLSFEDGRVEADGDWVIPAHGHRLFFGVPDVEFFLRLVRLSPLGTACLTTHLLRTGPAGRLSRAFPMTEDRVDGAGLVKAGERFAVRVENVSDEPCVVRPIAIGAGRFGEGNPHNDYSLSLRPVPDYVEMDIGGMGIVFGSSSREHATSRRPSRQGESAL